VERGGPAVAVGRDRGRVVRREAVVADTGGRGSGEQGVRRRGRGGPRSPRCWSRRRRRPLGGIPHRPAAPPSSLSAGGGGPAVAGGHLAASLIVPPPRPPRSVQVEEVPARVGSSSSASTNRSI
jgi:hypothetical protein